MTKPIRTSPTMFFMVALSAIALFVTSVAAQTGSTSIRGNVTDSTGAVVAGATVRLINEEKGFSRTTTTNSDGAYNFVGIPSDKYRVEIEANGFKKVVRTDVSALVDKSTEANAVLEVGN